MTALQLPVPVCRRPDKVAFPTRALARQARRRIADGGRHDLSVYRCSCGLWHVGHATADERTKIREAR